MENHPFPINTPIVMADSFLFVKVLEHGFFVQSGEAGELFGRDELVGLLAQLFAQLAQDAVTGLEAFTGDALDVLGVYANHLLFHDPFLPF